MVTLDGIDGFFDQYFEAVQPGEIIRFAVLIGGPSAVPDSIRALEALPFVTARVTRAGEIDGDVEIRSLSTLGEWSRSLALTAVPLTKLQLEFDDAPLGALVAQASHDGSAYWRRGARFWRSSSETSAIAVSRDEAGLRVMAIYTHARPGFVAAIR